jgi:GGDEF domain-containing protein
MDSESNKPTNFSAADSALGYLYQIRLALLSSLRRLSKDVSFTVYFETLDDVVFEQVGMPVELLQLKHHCKRAANLTDASPDLWKSLRVWMEGRANDTIPADGQLFLVTTSAVGPGSAVSMLLAEKRDVAEAAKRLANIATTSTNLTNAPAYQLFRELGDDARIQLLESVTVIPQAPSIDDTGSELRQEVRLTVRREHVESFLSRLEGWWFGRALRQMIDPETSPILSNELESEVDDLREQFKLDALPVDQDILDAEVDAEAYENAIFVHQAKLTGISNRRVLAAIRDYFRAFEQRSRWMREDLLLVGELDRYEQYLREEWQLEFDRVADELGEDAADDAKRRAAQAIYAWVEMSCFPIREQVKHPSMSRGSLHILADRLHVGWHPDFMDRLQHLLEPKEAS